MGITSTLTTDGYQVDPIPNPAPVPSNVMPQTEAKVGVAGQMVPYSRGDHIHERLTSATNVTLDSNGDATVTFTRLFTTAPIISYSYGETTNNQPIIVKRVAWIQDGSNNYTGMTIHGYRLQKLPATLALLSALISYDIAGASAAGISVDVIALKSSVT